MVILYIGNNLTNKSKYNSTYTTLSSLFEYEGYSVKKTSSLTNKILRLFSMLFATVRYSRKVDYILIDTFSTSNFYFALLTSQLARLLKANYIPILHGGNLPHRLDKNPKLSRMIFSNSYRNVAPSGYLKYEFEKRGFKTEFIPNVINIQEYHFVKRTKIQPKILWVRAFAHLYNPNMAIRVVNQLKEIYPDVLLCMVGPDKGDGSFQETQQLVKELALDKNVIFTGVLPKEEWHQLSVDYDIFINTTTIDNTPVSVMEAMALGLPTISTKVGGIPYLLNDQIDSLLVENNNINHMVDSVVYLLNNHDFTKKIAENARLKVESFDWKKVRLKWFDILKKS